MFSSPTHKRLCRDLNLDDILKKPIRVYTDSSGKMHETKFCLYWQRTNGTGHDSTPPLKERLVPLEILNSRTKSCMCLMRSDRSAAGRQELDEVHGTASWLTDRDRTIKTFLSDEYQTLTFERLRHLDPACWGRRPYNIRHSSEQMTTRIERYIELQDQQIQDMLIPTLKQNIHDYLDRTIRSEMVVEKVLAVYKGSPSTIRATRRLVGFWGSLVTDGVPPLQRRRLILKRVHKFALSEMLDTRMLGIHTKRWLHDAERLLASTSVPHLSEMPLRLALYSAPQRQKDLHRKFLIPFSVHQGGTWFLVALPDPVRKRLAKANVRAIQCSDEFVTPKAFEIISALWEPNSDEPTGDLNRLAAAAMALA